MSRLHAVHFTGTSSTKWGRLQPAPGFSPVGSVAPLPLCSPEKGGAEAPRRLKPAPPEAHAISRFLLGVALAHCVTLGGAAALPPVVAIINGQKITAARLEKRLAQSRSMDPERFDSMDWPKKRTALIRVLRALVIQELEYQEALQQNIAVPDEEVEALLVREKSRFASYQDFENSLSAGHITVPEWKQEMRKVLMIRRLEQKAAGGMPRSKWLAERQEWVKRLLDKAQVWTWQP